MNPAHLVKKITDTAQFLCRRGNYNDHADPAINLRKSLAVSMLSQISNLPTLTSADADTLLTALENQPYGEFTVNVAHPSTRVSHAQRQRAWRRPHTLRHKS